MSKSPHHLCVCPTGRTTSCAPPTQASLTLLAALAKFCRLSRPTSSCTMATFIVCASRSISDRGPRLWEQYDHAGRPQHYIINLRIYSKVESRRSSADKLYKASPHPSALATEPLCYRMPALLRLLASTVSLTAAKTISMFFVSVAHVR